MATFNFTPQYAWDKTLEYRVLTTEFESGKEQRRYKGRQPREWGLAFHGKRTWIAQIEAFFAAQKGPFLAFSWVPPGESQLISVRFKEDTLKVQHAGMGLAQVQVSFREVL